MSFNFGTSTPTTTTGMTTGTLQTPATKASGFSLGTVTSSGLFGSTPTSAPSFSLGGAGDSKTPVQTAAVKPIAAAAPLSSTFSLGSTLATTTTATPSFSGFGVTPTTSAAVPLASTPGFSFGAATTTSAPLSFSLTSAAKTSTTSSAPAPAPVSTSAPAAPIGNITFGQLEETINKWTLELDEQEKVFVSQAAQINSWDRLLNSNSEKIVTLNSEVAMMRLQQQQLDHELDFILAQQRELEEVLAPLEKQAAEGPSISDPEREHTYHMAETLDTQLKQMSEDLREIIEHLNESSRTQDNSDPVVQIGRILNAHMNSLDWIDQMTLNIQNQLENVTKLHDIHRRENERSFRISYE